MLLVPRLVLLRRGDLVHREHAARALDVEVGEQLPDDPPRRLRVVHRHPFQHIEGQPPERALRRQRSPPRQPTLVPIPVGQVREEERVQRGAVGGEVSQREERRRGCEQAAVEREGGEARPRLRERLEGGVVGDQCGVADEERERFEAAQREEALQELRHVQHLGRVPQRLREELERA